MAFFVQPKMSVDQPEAVIEKAMAHRDKLQSDVDQIQRQFEESSKRGDPEKPGTSAYVWGLQLDEARSKLAEAERELGTVIDQTAITAPAEPPAPKQDAEPDAEEPIISAGPERDRALDILMDMRHEAVSPIHASITKYGDQYRLRHELALPYMVAPLANGNYGMRGGLAIGYGLGGSSYAGVSPTPVNTGAQTITDIGAGTANYYYELHFTYSSPTITFVGGAWVATPTANTDTDCYIVIGSRTGPGQEWVQEHVGNIYIPIR